MLIRGKSPPLLRSSYTTVINKNGNQKHLIRYIWIEKKTFHVLQYVKISIKAPFFDIDILKKTNTFIALVKLIIVYRNTDAPS